MDKMVLKHSRIEINDYNMGDCPRLEYMFSVWNPTCHQSFIKALDYDEENKRLFVPRGIDIHYLKNLFMCEPAVDRKCDDYIDTDPIPIKYLTKDNRQAEILEFLIGQGKYYYTRTKSQLSVNSTTGSGKTFVTVAAMCYTGSRCIIIANSLEWLKQWQNRVLEYTPLNSNQIYMISGVGSIFKILSRDPLQYQVFLISHATIKSYGDKYGWHKVDELFRYFKCSMKVFDEAHLYFDNLCKIDYHSNTKKTIYLTATPARSNQEENQIYQMYFKNIPSISLFDENNDPHVNYCAIHFNSHPSPIDISKCKNQYGFDRNKYIDYIVKRPNFLKLVIVIMEMLFNIDGKSIIYIGTNSGITEVYNYIVSQLPFFESAISIYTSVVDKQVKEMSLRNKLILSTTKSSGTASDIKYLKVVVNLAEPFKSHVLAKQTLGRPREEGLYIDLVDHGFFFTKKYYESKKPVFSVYAKSCKDIWMDDAEIDKRFNNIINKYQEHKVMCTRIYDR